MKEAIILGGGQRNTNKKGYSYYVTQVGGKGKRKGKGINGG